jgi:hypothetical protein
LSYPDLDPIETAAGVGRRPADAEGINCGDLLPFTRLIEADRRGSIAVEGERETFGGSIPYPILYLECCACHTVAV